MKELANGAVGVRAPGVGGADAAAEKAVEELLATLSAIVSSTPAGILVYEFREPDGFVLLNGNPEALNITGLKLEYYRGKTMGGAWLTAEGEELTPAFLGALQSGVTFECNDAVFTANGNRKAVRLRAFKLPEGRLGLSFDDLTRERELEHELERIQRQAHTEILVCSEKLNAEKEELRSKLSELKGAEEDARANAAEFEIRFSEQMIELAQLTEKYNRECAGRALAENALKEAESRRRMLVDNLPVGILSCNGAGEITELNEEMLYLLGAPSLQEAKSINVLQFEPFVQAGLAAAIRNCLISGDRFVGDFPHRSAWGKQMYARVRLAAIRTSGGEIVGAHAVMEDILDGKRAEASLLRAERMKAVAEMAGGVSHNFNNWLQVASGGAQTALSFLESRNYSEIRPLLEQILDGTKQAAHTVRRLQQFARTSPECVPAQEKVIDLTEIVAESLEIRKLCAPPNLNRAAAPIVRAEYMDGCYVSGCPDQFTEMTLNFLKNATEACLEGGEMVIRTAHDAKNVTLSVEDTGHGIPENDYEQIFQPFWTTRESHVGIGLTVNQGIAQRCGAVIAVKSESGKGACFSVTFPLAVKKEARVSIYPAADPDRRLSILLIDDDRPVVTILEKGLKKQKQNTYIALSGQDGLDIFEHTEVDCIVCDLAMQGMDGWEVSRAIQAVCMEKGIAKPPFILLTGWAGQLAQGEIARHPDVDRIVEKPVTIPSLLAIIREEVSKSEFA